MREIRLSGSEGGGTDSHLLSLPLSSISSGIERSLFIYFRVTWPNRRAPNRCSPTAPPCQSQGWLIHKLFRCNMMQAEY